ncbi:MAG: FAD-dependent oxidoreductase [Candidatus Aenigmarchaeota archaeon]|nr:FAD-dependent oxidoreductase [Candidatus Aenigmarchaeota archaeon]
MALPKLDCSFDVIVVGGGFCGINTAKILDKALPKDSTLALFDKKDYFEYTPSVHKVIFNLDYERKIAIPFQNLLKRTAVFTESVTAITPAYIKTKNGTYGFKYLVVSSGIAYPILLENKKNTFVLKNCEEAKKIHKALKKAENIIIVGGGLIGAEIAGEIVTKTTGKNITMIEPGERILSRNPQGASRWAARFLTKRGCKIIYGEKVIKQKNGQVITDKYSRIPADIIFWCAGIKCDSSFLANGLLKAVNKRKCVLVNDLLQIEGFPNIFCGGDLTAIPEEKTAQNAEHHARIIAHNILTSLGVCKTLFKHAHGSGPLVISFGDWAGLFIYKSFWWGGIIPAIMKKMIEIRVIANLIKFRTKYF